METSTSPTRSQIIAALNDVVASNSALLSDGSFDGATFNIDIAADAIQAGQVAPADNDGLITDETTKLAFGAFMSDGAWWVPARVLFDYATGDVVGAATPEQIEASLAAGDAGAILIDAAGYVIADGSWEAQQPGVRTVYVA